MAPFIGVLAVTFGNITGCNKIQNCILMREHPFYIQHIRAHTSLPGPMVKGNAIADSATRDMVFLSQSSIESAKNFHQLYHVPASTLRQLLFPLSRERHVGHQNWYRWIHVHIVISQKMGYA